MRFVLQYSLRPEYSHLVLILTLPEHLRTLLEDDSAAAGQFVDRFARFHRAEPWNSEDGRKAASVGSASSSSSARPLASLKPLYHCLQCSMIGLRAARLAHRKETGHIFCKFTLEFFFCFISRRTYMASPFANT